MTRLNLLIIVSLIAVTAQAAPNHLAGFEQTTECAALMAVISQQQQGQLSAKQAVFEKIGYTLGKAENHRQDGNIKANTEKTYQQKVLELYQNLPTLNTKQRQEKQQQYQQCLIDAELYDPKTQIPALIEKAKQQRP